MPITLTPDERQRYKTHGRKRGFLKAKDAEHLKVNLPGLTLVESNDREMLLAQFKQEKPEESKLWLEIGFGNGEYLSHLAAIHPQDCFIGIDVFLEGVSALLRRLERQDSVNVKVAVDNANIVLLEKIPLNSLDRVVINFPDPWPKKRHHKRRLVQKAFLDLISQRMVSGGQVSLATDWAEYSEWMLEHLEAHEDFLNTITNGGFAPQPENWLTTSFQKKGIKANRPARHLLFQKR
ncbi:MAG: tRNA (guanosine(46)-N7)-methyltransferase TrmB [Magnetococcales bacterium]|nr:tRNA (guanosine(46)-N7)-methyltransferase TrmB [Magnetococcales bacterium]